MEAGLIHFFAEFRLVFQALTALPGLGGLVESTLAYNAHR